MSEGHRLSNFYFKISWIIKKLLFSTKQIYRYNRYLQAFPR